MTDMELRHHDPAPPPRSFGLHRRMRAVGPAVIALVLLIGLLIGVGWVIPGGIAVAQADSTSGDQKVAVFEDAVVRPGETWDNVVVVGGDLLIQGTVENKVVVVFGDVTIADSARVGGATNADDASVVSVFGDVTVQSGAVVRGRTVDVGGGVVGIDLSVGDSVLRPWRSGAILNWIWSTLFLAVVAVIITAIAPRQVAAVRERTRHHFFSSLGWGALGVIIGVPIVTAALIISIIGIILVVPWLTIALPIMSLFGLVAVGAMVGRLLLGPGEDKRGPVMLAAVLGVIVMNIARWIPVAWIVILGVLWLVGFGATYVAIWAWLRDRRRRRREAAAREQAARAAAAGAATAPYPSGQPVTPTGPPAGTPPPAPAWPQPPSGPAPTTPATSGPAGPGAGVAGSQPPVSQTATPPVSRTGNTEAPPVAGNEASPAAGTGDAASGVPPVSGVGEAIAEASPTTDPGAAVEAPEEGLPDSGESPPD
jgi:hypothetical protein